MARGGGVQKKTSTMCQLCDYPTGTADIRWNGLGVNDIGQLDPIVPAAEDEVKVDMKDEDDAKWEQLLALIGKRPAPRALRPALPRA